MLLIQDQILRNKNLEAGIVVEELTEPRVGIWRGSGCESLAGELSPPTFQTQELPSLHSSPAGQSQQMDALEAARCQAEGRTLAPP